MKCYLAGPMSGLPQHNLPAFEAAAEDIRTMCGVEVISPAEIDQQDAVEFRDFCLNDLDGSRTNIGAGAVICGLSWGDLLARDVKLIADEVDSIVLLPNWEQSKGARLEAFVAISCGHPCYIYSAEAPIVEVPASYIMEKIHEGIL